MLRPRHSSVSEDSDFSLVDGNHFDYASLNARDSFRNRSPSPEAVTDYATRSNGNVWNAFIDLTFFFQVCKFRYILAILFPACTISILIAVPPLNSVICKKNVIFYTS